MKKHIKTLLFLFICSIVFSSCTRRIADFTIISTKSHSLDINKAKGKETSGHSMTFMGASSNIKDAVDDALKKAGSGYDLLIDGVVRQRVYPFFAGFVVEGTAIRSGDLKVSMGEEGFKKWCEAHNIFDAKTVVVQD